MSVKPQNCKNYISTSKNWCNMLQLTEEDKKILDQFPKYDDNKPESWVGSREYWEFIFGEETNRDPELHKAFSELHKQIVDSVIQFCKKHNLEVDAFDISADGLLGSREYGEWTCSTDSSMSMYIRKKGKCGLSYIDRDNCFLYEIWTKDLKKNGNRIVPNKVVAQWFLLMLKMLPSISTILLFQMLINMLSH